MTAYLDVPQRVICLHMDGALWDAIPHIFTRYLQGDKVYATNFSPNRAIGYLRYSFHINLTTLDNLINAALRSMGFERFVYN
jgi:hypothetical protein